MPVVIEFFDNEFVRLFIRGGPVMFILLGLSVLALAIILAKIHQFASCRLKRTDFIEKAQAHIENGEFAKAQADLVRSPHPVARVLEEVLVVARLPRTADDRESAVRRAGMAEIQAMESRLRGLDLIGTIAPLLGLLGTVLGMIQAFAQVEHFGATVDPSLLAGGIWQALLTTAYGLMIAIPSLSVAYLLQNKVEQVRELMKEAATQALAAASRTADRRKAS